MTYNSSGIGGKVKGAISGNGLGLYRIDETLKPTQLDIINGVHANRFIHLSTGSCREPKMEIPAERINS
jgi:hypothetical protein